MQSENRSFNREFEGGEKNEPDFLAELTPHRSLGKTGFIILMSFVAITCFIAGMLFLVIGAWPVFLFFGLDVLIVWFAFKLNYRSGRIMERVSVNRHELRVQRVSANGRIEEKVFNPFWTRFEVDRHKEIGITSMRLVNRDTNVQIGSFLNPKDRESFALAFSNALGRAKQA